MSSIFKSPERVLYRALTADPLIAGLSGLNIYPVIAPASTPLPFVVYRRSAINRSQTLSGVVGAPTVTVEYDTLAARYEQARELADAIRACLDGWGGSSYGVVVNRVSLENESDGLVTLDGGETPPVYQISQSYDVLWQEA